MRRKKCELTVQLAGMEWKRKGNKKTLLDGHLEIYMQIFEDGTWTGLSCHCMSQLQKVDGSMLWDESLSTESSPLLAVVSPLSSPQLSPILQFSNSPIRHVQITVGTGMGGDEVHTVCTVLGCGEGEYALSIFSVK